MAFTLTVPIHTADVTTLAVVGNVTETATIDVVGPDNFSVYADLVAGDLHRKADMFRGWDFLYKGWKSHAYDPFPASTVTPDYFIVKFDGPNIANRRITTNLALLVEGDIGFGIGANIVDTQNRTVLARTAFDLLRSYFIETRK